MDGGKLTATYKMVEENVIRSMPITTGRGCYIVWRTHIAIYLFRSALLADEDIDALEAQENIQVYLEYKGLLITHTDYKEKFLRWNKWNDEKAQTRFLLSNI